MSKRLIIWKKNPLSIIHSEKKKKEEEKLEVNQGTSFGKYIYFFNFLLQSVILIGSYNFGAQLVLIRIKMERYFI